MSTMVLDGKGVVQRCPACGQRNRIAFSALGGTVRCGNCKAELPGISEPIEIDDEPMLESLIRQSRLPLLVDFWADWCGPCKMMAPELHRVAGILRDKVLVAKVNTESLPIAGQRFNISALPTLVLFREGRELNRIQGARPAAQIHKFVEENIRSFD